MRSRTLSICLLSGGASALVAGAFVVFGFGVALLVLGVLLIAAEWLIR